MARNLGTVALPYKDPAAKAARARIYNATPEGLAKQRARIARANKTEKGRRAKADYKKTAKGRESESRYHSSPDVRLRRLMRRRLLHAVKNGASKHLPTLEGLGMPLAQFKAYIESLPTWEPSFTWDNHGKVWHLDHVRPLGLFDLSDPLQYAEAVYYENLQPLSTEAHKEKTKRDIALIREARET